MLKFFTNLIFILMLFMLLSGIPLNMDVLEINPLRSNIDTPVTTEVPVHYILSDTIALSSINPDTLSVEVSSSDHSTPSDAFLSSLSVDITGYDPENTSGTDAATQDDRYLYTTTSYPIDGLVYNLVDESGTITLNIYLDHILDTFTPGYYHVDITGNFDNKPITSSGSFTWYDQDKSYLGTSDDEVSGRLTMTLYTPTKDYQYLVPVSKRVPYPKNRSRTLYRNLHAGPIEALNLIGEPTMPYASRIYINSGVASIYIYSPEQEGYEDRFGAVIEAITNSMTSLDFITETTFFIDGKQDVPFGGIDLTQHFMPTKQDIAYVGYSNASDYMMLMPIHLSKLAEIDADRYQMMFTVLQGDNTSYPKTEGIFPTIPAHIGLESYNLTDGLLTLNMSADFTSIYNDLSIEVASTYAKLMIDSILYSYSSFEDVSQVSITADGARIADYYGIDLSEPLTPQRYLNIEPEL